MARFSRGGGRWFFVFFLIATISLSRVVVGLSFAQEEGDEELVFYEEQPEQVRISAKDLIKGEILLRQMRVRDALSFYEELLQYPVNDERKGYVYYRLAKVHYALGNYEKALEYVKRAITLLESRYHLYTAMYLRMKIYADMGWYREAKQIALYLLDAKYVDAPEKDLYLFMARADVALEDAVNAVHDYEKAFLLSDLEDRIVIYDEFEAKTGDIFTKVKNPLVFADCYEGLSSLRFRVYVLESAVRFCLREKFLGFAQIFLDELRPLAPLEEREDVLQAFEMQLDSFKREKPVVAVYLPFKGRFADYGKSFLMGLELSYRERARAGGVFDPIYFVEVRDTSSPEVSLDRDIYERRLGPEVVAVAGPLRSSEAYFVTPLPDSPPIFYLGQRLVEKGEGFINFGLKPFQEMLKLADLALSKGVFSCAIFYPENGYGRAYRDALVRALALLRIRVAGEYAYSTRTRNFIPMIKGIVGEDVFEEFAKAEERDVTMPVPFDGVFILDTPGRGVLLHSQMFHSNIKVPCFVPSSWTEWEVLSDIKGDVRDLYAVSDFYPFSPKKANRSFLATFKDTFGGVPDRYSAYGFDFGSLVSEFLKEKYLSEKSGEVDFPRFEEWIKEREVVGVSAPGELDFNGVLVRNLYTFRVDLGRIELVFPEFY